MWNSVQVRMSLYLIYNVWIQLFCVFASWENTETGFDTTVMWNLFFFVITRYLNQALDLQTVQKTTARFSGCIFSLPTNYLAILSVCSGYDFAYLLKVLTAQNLPSEESEFFDLLKLYFPNIYDVKYLMKSCKSLKGGLQEVAELLEVCRFEKIFLCVCSVQTFTLYRSTESNSRRIKFGGIM